MAPPTTYAARAFAERRFLIYVRCSATPCPLPAKTDAFEGIKSTILLFDLETAVNTRGGIKPLECWLMQHHASRRCTQR